MQSMVQILLELVNACTELCKVLQAGITEVDMEDEIDTDGAQHQPESLAAARAKGRWVCCTISSCCHFMFIDNQNGES